MTETTMLSAMLKQWALTFSRSGNNLRLEVWDARHDTTSLYTCDTSLGASALIVRAYADFKAEYL